MPTLFVVAGPNGCGKSTLTRTKWFTGVEVIDPDAIARSMAPGAPARAAREALRQRRRVLHAGRTHLVETTLAGSGVLRLMAARTAGYRIELHYVCVDSPDQALYRTRNRVALGGHDVPEPDVRRRFARSLAHLPAAIAVPPRLASTTTPIRNGPTAKLRFSWEPTGGLRSVFRVGRPRHWIHFPALEAGRSALSGSASGLGIGFLGSGLGRLHARFAALHAPILGDERVDLGPEVVKE